MEFVCGKHPVRKVDDEEVADHGYTDGRSSFYYEDPPPAFDTVRSIQFDDRKCQNVPEAAHEQVDQVPPSGTRLISGAYSKLPRRNLPTDSGLYLETPIPSRQQEHAAWQVPGLEHADQHPANYNVPPVVDEAHTEHDSPPTDRESVQ